DLIRNRLFRIGPDGRPIREPAPADIDPCLAEAPCMPPPQAVQGFRGRLRRLALVQAASEIVRAHPALRPLTRPGAATIGERLELCEQEYRVYARSQPRVFSNM